MKIFYNGKIGFVCVGLLFLMAMFFLIAPNCFAYTQLEDITTLRNDASLTAYYRLENNLTDSKNAKNGTWSGTGTFATTTTPFSGYYATLNGSSNKFYVPKLAFDSTVNTQSLSIWFRPHNHTSNRYLFSDYGGAASNSCYPYQGIRFFTTGRTYITWRSSGAIDHAIYPTETITDNVWNNLVLVRSGATVKEYLNGVHVNSDISTTSDANYFINQTAAVNAYFGASSDNYTQTSFSDYFDGDLDDISIWKKALSASEVSMLYLGAFCGNSICDGGETFATCPGDCPTFTIDMINLGPPSYATTSPGGTGQSASPGEVKIYGHCTTYGSIILWQKQMLPFYVGWDKAFSEATSYGILEGVCLFSAAVGHESELVYNLPVPAAYYANYFCLSETDNWNDEAHTFDYIGAGQCTDFTLFTPGFNWQDSTSTSTNIFGGSNYDKACTPEEWASTSTIPILGWNVQQTVCKTKLWLLDTLLNPITWAQEKMIAFKDWIMTIFPFNIIQSIKGEFDTQITPYTFFRIKTAYAAPAFSTSTGVFNGDFTFVGNFGTGTPTTTFSFFSVANITDLIGVNAFTALYLIFRILIWVAFIAYCYDLVVYRVHEIFGHE
jgi:hypothetical protein